QIANLIRQEDHMRMLTSPPLPTATIADCPQCGGITHLKLIEPDLKDPLKARHVFECEECSLPRIYSIEGRFNSTLGKRETGTGAYGAPAKRAQTLAELF
ncbi:MAG: hypothetical protein ACM3Z4_01715, partial [Hyphomicrobiales bacterium]